MAELTLRLLGPPRVELNGSPLAVDTRKATALLIYLAVTGEPHSREALAAMFWPEGDAAHAKAALRRTLSSLRKALNGEWVQVGRDQLSLAPAWLDIQEFTRLVESTQSHGHRELEVCGRCVEPLSRAVELYRGDYLSGFTLPDSPQFDEWQYFTGQSLQRMFSESLRRLALAHQTLGELDRALELAERLLALDPLNEAAHRDLMLLYARLGRRDLALRQYRECVRILQEELGAAPLEETVELHEQIAAGELETASPSAAEPVPAGPARVPQARLVGRRVELETIRDWHREASGRPLVGILAGEDGIGKTRLAEEFLAIAAGEGSRVLRASCYEGETSFAYRPWIDAFRQGLAMGDADRRLAGVPRIWRGEAARLLPELLEHSPEVRRPDPLRAEAGEARFLDGLIRLLGALTAGPRPGVVFLDDLHWADEATLAFLAYLVRHGREPRLLVLGGWRTGTSADQQRLRAWTARLPQPALRLVELARLSRTEVAELAELSTAAGEAAPVLLYDATEGLPLFVVESLSAGRAGSRPDGWQLPPTVRQMLTNRLAGLSGTARQLLGAAAIVGRLFEYETLRAVSGRNPEEIVAGLEELLAAGLIREYGEQQPPLGPAYDFAHGLMRELALEHTTQARQRLLHARAAAALGRASRQAAVAARIARHHELAGEPRQAAAHYVQAGDYARGLFANERALDHYRSALALGHPDPAHLHEAAGDLLTLLGDYPAAIESFEAAGAYAPLAATTRLEHKLGGVYERWGRWDQAKLHLEAAAQASPEPAEQARILADWSLTAYRAGNRVEAAELIQAAQRSAERAGDRQALSQCHNVLGILARAEGDPGRARAQLLLSLGHAESLGDPIARAAALNNLALALGDSGEVAQAIRTAREALELSETIGDRHRAAALHSNLADLMHRAGEETQARAHLRESARLFTEIGVEPGQFEPEIWKLVEW